MSRTPEKRPGVKNKNDLLKDPFFKGIDWDDLLNKRIRPPRLGYSEDDDIEMPIVKIFGKMIPIIPIEFSRIVPRY